MPTPEDGTIGTWRRARRTRRRPPPAGDGVPAAERIAFDGVPELIESPSRIEAAGTRPKLIEEFVGRVNTGESRVSVARMSDSSPEPEGAEYVAICLPAFSPETVRRDAA
jgi:hypothetical protein